MAVVTIYHNPRCATSRKTLALIRARGIEPVIVEYLKSPPDAKTLRGLLKKLRLPAEAIVRKKEKEYKKLGLDRPSVTDAAVIRAIVRHPILLERPIVVSGSRAALGRPPENVEKIL